MPTSQDICPVCGKSKDTRAKQCKRCFMDSGGPRMGTGKWWHLHQGTGYLICCIDRIKRYQHRDIMSFYLGRPLSGDECVHHRDGVKTNNDIANLELQSLSQHGKVHTNTERAKKMSLLGHQARWGVVI